MLAGMYRIALDVSIALTLVASFVTVQNAWVHLATGIAFCVLVPIHLLTRRRFAAAAFTGRVSAWRTAGVWFLMAMFLAMLVSGVIQWAGSSAAIAWHSGTGVALVVVAAVHVWTRRRRLRPARTGRSGADEADVRQPAT